MRYVMWSVGRSVRCTRRRWFPRLGQPASTGTSAELEMGGRALPTRTIAQPTAALLRSDTCLERGVAGRRLSMRHILPTRLPCRSVTRAVVVVPGWREMGGHLGVSYTCARAEPAQHGAVWVVCPSWGRLAGGWALQVRRFMFLQAEHLPHMAGANTAGSEGLDCWTFGRYTALET